MACCPRCAEEGRPSEHDKLIKGLCRHHYNKQYRQTAAGRAANRRYTQSEKGRATLRRYQQSEKGQASDKKYKQSDKGLEVHQRSRANYVAKNPRSPIARAVEEQKRSANSVEDLETAKEQDV